MPEGWTVAWEEEYGYWVVRTEDGIYWGGFATEDDALAEAEQAVPLED